MAFISGQLIMACIQLRFPPIHAGLRLSDENKQRNDSRLGTGCSVMKTTHNPVRFTKHKHRKKSQKWEFEISESEDFYILLC